MCFRGAGLGVEAFIWQVNHERYSSCFMQMGLSQNRVVSIIPGLGFRVSFKDCYKGWGTLSRGSCSDDSPISGLCQGACDWDVPSLARFSQKHEESLHVAVRFRCIPCLRDGLGSRRTLSSYGKALKSPKPV